MTTDERGRLKMLPVRPRSTPHDEETSPSANSNFYIPEIHPPLLYAPRQQNALAPSDPSADRYQFPYYSAPCETPPEHAEYPCHPLSLENRVWQSSETYQGEISSPISTYLLIWSLHSLHVHPPHSLQRPPLPLGGSLHRFHATPRPTTTLRRGISGSWI